MTRACLRFEPVSGCGTPLTDARPLHRSCSSWPACGGANGSIRYEAELTHGANAGLKKGVSFLKEFKEQFPLLSWADIIQLASALAIECCGGPTLPMLYGRVDVAAPEQCPKEGNLPDAKPPFGGGARDAPSHLRAIFYRMGFNDQEIVALSGAHALGRCHTTASGYDGPWTPTPTTFNNAYYTLLTNLDWKPKEWSGPYQYVAGPKGSLMMLPTDLVLLQDKSFAKYVKVYAKDAEKFNNDFTKAFQKLEELGTNNLSPTEWT